MTVYFAQGAPDQDFSPEQMKNVLADFYNSYKPKRVLALPPDQTRLDSRAGELTDLSFQLLGDRLVDVMPALGTHEPMTDKQLDKMFPGTPKSLFRPHRWRDDVVTLGQIESDFVKRVTEGAYDRPWAAQTNKMLLEGNHDLILSIGQVVPHEVIGMANYTKNIFVGVGGPEGINESHYLSALYGMERVMGRCDTPLRRILNEAADRFCRDLPIVYILTVIESQADGRKVMRGLYIGTDHDIFEQAGELSAQVNCYRLEEAPETMVVYMHPDKYNKTWIANKAIYRTRMAMADGGHLIVLAPGVKTFGEDAEVDRLIRKYGYMTTPEVLDAVANNDDLRANLSAAAHLIHGSTENRFNVTYATDLLPPELIHKARYQHASPSSVMNEYGCVNLADGWHTTSTGKRFYFLNDPGLGLWMYTGHEHAF